MSFQSLCVFYPKFRAQIDFIMFARAPIICDPLVKMVSVVKSQTSGLQILPSSELAHYGVSPSTSKVTKVGHLVWRAPFGVPAKALGLSMTGIGPLNPQPEELLVTLNFGGHISQQTVIFAHFEVKKLNMLSGIRVNQKGSIKYCQFNQQRIQKTILLSNFPNLGCQGLYFRVNHNTSRGTHNYCVRVTKRHRDMMSSSDS